jgi:hypothetical protein
MENGEIIAVLPQLSDFDDLITQIAAIAKALAYRASEAGDDPERWGKSGFLVSHYGRDKYRDLAEQGRLYAIVQDNHQVVAFAAIYRPEQLPDVDDKGREFIRKTYGRVPVVKQIASERTHAGQGWARRLNDHFSHQYPDDPVFAAIVEEPRNHRSEGFHTRIGFHKCTTYRDHPDGKPRGIWRRPPSGQQGSLLPRNTK